MSKTTFDELKAALLRNNVNKKPLVVVKRVEDIGLIKNIPCLMKKYK